MRVEAPVAVISGLRDEGYLYLQGWPKVASSEASNDQLVVSVGATVSDCVDLIPLPQAAHILADTIESWWGSHRWMYPGDAMVLRSHHQTATVDGTTIPQLAGLIEAWSSDLREATWVRERDAPAPALVWCAGHVQIRFTRGDQVTVTYPATMRAPDAPCSLVTRSRQEHVVLIDEHTDPAAVVVWLGYPTDAGATANEMLAEPAPVGMLPRSLALPRARGVDAQGRRTLTRDGAETPAMGLRWAHPPSAGGC